jgi:oxygen-independent coproporphyrinogen III oxidase
MLSMLRSAPQLSQVLETLRRRYGVPLPRYTSYPAVPDWSDDVTAASWGTHLGMLDQDRDVIALYVHLPFCASQCLYCGCNATVTRRDDVKERYLDRLAREIAMVRAAIGHRARVVEMHWGGGTPNSLSEVQLDRLHGMLGDAFHISAATECSVEADPRLVTRAQLDVLRRLGFSRISFGVQDLDPVVQRAIGRVQPDVMVARVMGEARDAGFLGINVDLIYGLPEQTTDGFRRTLDRVLAFAPDRLACFGYAHVPWMRPHQRRMNAAVIPVGDARVALFHHAVTTLVHAGYAWIGLDHFALPGDALAAASRGGRVHRNFMGYTTQRSDHVLGLGTSAISDVHGWFAQQAPTLGAWQRAIDAGLLPITRGHRRSYDDVRRSEAIMQLMCSRRIAQAEFDALAIDGVATSDRLVLDGLLQPEGGAYIVTTLGQFFLRNISAVLDGYRMDGSARRFSAAV